MANSIELKSISELLEMNFFIPSYQRGYRWDKQQIEELLEDIYEFATKPNKTEKEFYCLQPIIVKEHNWKKKGSDEIINGWEVVDGQQRLTSLRILLTFLIKEHLNGKSLKDSYGKDLFTLTYETRDDSQIFLDNLTEERDDNIDYYFISSAYKIIRKWFEKSKKPYGVRNAILSTLVFPYKDTDNPYKGVVQVIWYEINANSKKENIAIDTFLRINQGKIPLENSELIKALFLKDRDFSKNDNLENEIARLKQLQIATEWDQIENSFQNEDFWWFLNEGQNSIPARIDYIFDLFKQELIQEDPELKIRNTLPPEEVEERKKTSPSVEEKLGTDSYSSFRYFYQYFQNHSDFASLKTEWDRVRMYHSTLIEWFNNPVWYHYIGFLISSGESILEIYLLTKKDYGTGVEITTKEEITSSLKKKIKNKFESLSWKRELDQDIFLDLSYSNEKRSFIRQLLLLYNIEYIVRQCQNDTLLMKFPFRSFKETNIPGGGKMLWDIEHVDSFNANNLSNRDSRITWLQFALEEIEDVPENTLLREKIIEYIQNEKPSILFEELHQRIIDLLKENDPDENTKNNIGNLVLLDAGTNRGYGNSLFPTKRKRIIEKDKVGVFIPLCTKNVFLKYFDTTGQSNAKWRIDDMKRYRKDIADTLEMFLPTKPIISTENEQL